MKQVPYITLEDLNTVLNAAVTDYTISKKTAAHLQDLAIDFTRELIRKSEATKSLSARRERAVKSLSLCVAISKSRVQRHRQAQESRYQQALAGIKLGAEIHTKELKAGFYEKINACKASLDVLSVEYKQAPDEDSRIAVMKKQRELQCSLREHQHAMLEALAEARSSLAEQIAHEDTVYRRDMSHRNCEMSEIDYRRLHMHQRISWATPGDLDTIEAELAQWQQDLESRKKGGEA